MQQLCKTCAEECFVEAGCPCLYTGASCLACPDCFNPPDLDSGSLPTPEQYRRMHAERVALEDVAKAARILVECFRKPSAVTRGMAVSILEMALSELDAALEEPKP